MIEDVNLVISVIINEANTMTLAFHPVE